jgi:tRNA pseudouridine38-40 synthase
LPKYKMTISYDGTNYGGWQVQPNATSIQSLLEYALLTLLKTKTAVTGSGRTDAGVHATGQVAHFISENPLDLYKISHCLNGLLPKEVRVLSLEEVSDEFHARYSATGKTYRYHLHLDKVLNPFNRLYSWHVPHKVSLPQLESLFPFFLGTKDFSAFANEAHKGAAAKNGVRTLNKLSVIKTEDGAYLEFEGTGFLYKMVRNITGTLMDICAGKLEKEALEEIFLSKDRKKAGSAAPPQGLFLVKVDYDSSSKEET